VDATGTIAREVKIASEAEALICYFNELGLEARPLSHPPP
jgi:hypothetical protein